MTAPATSALAPVAAAQTAPATMRRDPPDLWPEHARKLYEHLVGLYGTEDVLPTLAASWIGHQRSVNTQKSYARGFKVFEEFTREHGAHPMAVKFVLADTFRMYLETTPTWVRVKGGRRGEMARTGKPYSEASRANALSAASSFFTYLDKVSDDGVKNPFDAVQRPVLDPDYSPRGATPRRSGPSSCSPPATTTVSPRTASARTPCCSCSTPAACASTPCSTPASRTSDTTRGTPCCS